VRGGELGVSTSEIQDTGEPYLTKPYTYRSRWNESVARTHSTETFSAMLNTFGAAGLTVEDAIEPELSAEDRELYPHKQEWLDKYLGVILFVLSVR
jgi:hypothetical protein